MGILHELHLFQSDQAHTTKCGSRMMLITPGTLHSKTVANLGACGGSKLQ